MDIFEKLKKVGMLSFVVDNFIHLSQNPLHHSNNMKESVPTIFKDENTSSFNASISVEASLVTPLFVFSIVTLMSLLIMIKDQSVYYQDMNEKALLQWENSALTKDDSMINPKETYELAPIICFFPGLSVSVSDEILLHPFTGYTQDSGRSNERDSEVYVFVTENGTKYHIDSDCSYISIKPVTIEASSLDSIRNSDGCRYKKCRLCHPLKTGILFITSYGDSYHSDANCSALKRTVKMITLKEALEYGFTPCSKCS